MAAKKELTEGEKIVLLYTKIEQCANDIGHQGEDGTNTGGGGFSFTSNKQMMASVRMAWLKHKISVVCDVDSHSEKVVAAGNKSITRSTVNMIITVTCLETGYQIKSTFAGSEQCYQGKSFQKAITSAFKYWIFKNFKVSSKEEKDPDADMTEDINQTEVAIYDIQNAKSIDELKMLHSKHGHLGVAVKSELTNRKKQLTNV